MDRQRFDDLTKMLGTTTTRRQALKGLVGVSLSGLLAGLQGGSTRAAPKPSKPGKCLPEGKKTKDPSKCCSNATVDGRCCGVEFGSCAVTNCCAVATTPICHNGVCVACLPEGVPSSVPDECCSGQTSNGLCCGVMGDSCAISGCCSDGLFCHNGTCVGCLPEGAPSADPNTCCSKVLGDGVCCGDLTGSCAESGCCAASDQRCDNGVCIYCLPEGTPSSDPAKCCGGTISDGVCRAEECLPLGAATTDSSLCCSLLSHAGVCVECHPEGAYSPDPLDCCSGTANADQTCCGVLGGTCDASGCCQPGFTCCNGVCVPICPPPMTLNPDTCLCELSCSPIATACTQDSECCSGNCCSGVCVDTQSDKANCGGCGRSCPGSNHVCQGGLCGSLCGGEFCSFGSYCAQFGGAPVPAVCCPVCPEGLYPLPWNCGDGVCCCSNVGIVICDGYTCPY